MTAALLGDATLLRTATIEAVGGVALVELASGNCALIRTNPDGYVTSALTDYLLGGRDEAVTAWWQALDQLSTIADARHAHPAGKGGPHGA